MKTIRVYAVQGRRVPRLDDKFNVIPGAFVGCDDAGQPLAAGEEVPAHPFYVRARARGEITTQPASPEPASATKA